jgi:hypothetical protein
MIINSNPAALAAIEAWAKKHSPYEFNKVVNANGYKIRRRFRRYRWFSTYEILPNNPDHFNKDFEAIANDPDLLNFTLNFLIFMKV